MLYLGQVYDLDEREAMPPGLLRILHERPDVGRALYGAELLDAYASQPVLLAAEHAAWTLGLNRFVDRYIRPGLEDDLSPSAHWIWRKTYRGSHPALNYYSAHNILVCRLTWLAFRSNEVLPSDKNPRKLPMCPDTDAVLRRCVNPFHYAVAWERFDPAPNPMTRRGLADGRTPKSHRWYVDEAHRVFCRDCDQPLSAYQQDRFQRGQKLPRFVHCPTCYQRRMDQSGHLGRQRRGVTNPSHYTPYDWELKDKIAQAKAQLGIQDGVTYGHGIKPVAVQEPETPPVPEVDLVDWSQWPDI